MAKAKSKSIEVERITSGEVWPKLGSVMRHVRTEGKPLIVTFHGTDHVAIVPVSLLDPAA